MSMDKAYDPKKYEKDILARWDESGFYNPDNLPPVSGKPRHEPFSIILPPPNATGTLHLGHAMYVIQDIMIRHARMSGKKTLWLPGTDHAAIATQSKVESILLKKEGKTRHDLGRAEFVHRVEKFVDESKATIKHQLQSMGFSLDWSRERFTLDPALIEAVQTMFLKMFEDGLIYRGDRIVNWDPNMQTTVADDEMDYKEEKAPLYYLQYGPFVIATARPETKFGDKVVVLHPDDERYAQYKHGETLDVEWINGNVRATIIKDDSIDKEFGTGVMTITPWHDAHDFEIAERHELDRTQIIDLDGKMLPIAGEEFSGLPIRSARKKVVGKLQAKGLVVKVDENYVHNIATSYRGGGVIEPQIMKQWFVAVDKSVVEWKGHIMTLKEVAIDVVKSGDIEIVPDRFNKTYFHWMENLHDWCISRQLWYGHRIPAWYQKDDTERKNPVVKINQPSDEFVQDDDVLDTWFSAGIWTFSTLGWPEKTQDLKEYHPTSILETGYDILFFWVARMLLMTTYALREIPFKKVYLHGLVRDRQGRKMSKSLDNGIDPLAMTEKFGTDAVRLSLVIGTTAGNDSRLYEEKIAGYRNFVNKLWNVARFISQQDVHNYEDSIIDRWIISRLHTTIGQINEEYDCDQFGPAGDRLYNFVWHEFADWYIEMMKMTAIKVTAGRDVLQEILKLLHPMIPFVTEAIAKEMKFFDGLLMIEQWPAYRHTLRDPNLEMQFEHIKNLVNQIRKFRAEYRIDPKSRFPIIAQGRAMEPLEIHVIQHLANVVFGKAEYDIAVAIISGDYKFVIPLDLIIDVDREKIRIKKEMEVKERYLQGLEQKLANENFLSRASKDVIQATKMLRSTAHEELQHLKAAHRALSSGV